MSGATKPKPGSKRKNSWQDEAKKGAVRLSGMLVRDVPAAACRWRFVLRAIQTRFLPLPCWRSCKLYALGVSNALGVAFFGADLLRQACLRRAASISTTGALRLSSRNTSL
jgi:hypothetical protein